MAKFIAMIDTAKAAARLELLFNKLATVCETSKLDLTSKNKVRPNSWQ